LKVSKEFGPVQILVNNAGIIRDGLAVFMKPDQWSQVLETNLSGAFFCTQKVISPMIEAGRGRIVNISSVSGETGSAGQTNYAASKAGLIGLTKSLAQELAPHGVTVNAVAPGFIETDMTSTLKDHQKARTLEMIRMGRGASRRRLPPQCDSWRAKRQATLPET
jgi:3-oxoacyl-[acyl-carrier protein] reductase